MIIGEDIPTWLARLRLEYAGHAEILELIRIYDLTDIRLRRLAGRCSDHGLDPVKLLREAGTEG